MLDVGELAIRFYAYVLGDSQIADYVDKIGETVKLRNRQDGPIVAIHPSHYNDQ